MSSTPPTLTSSECPNCGATIDLSKIADGQRQIECEYCGSMLNLPRREKLREIRTQTIKIQVREPEALTPAKPQRATGGGLGCIFSLLVLGIVGVVLWQTSVFGLLEIDVNNSGLPNLPKIVAGARVFGSPFPLPRVDDGSQEVAYLTLAEKATNVVSVDMTKQVEKWRSRDFSDRFTDITLQADAERVFVADGDALVALNRANGEVAWEMTLPYAISTDYQCRFNACLRVFDNQVVARLKDGTLQAVNSATGKPAWTKQLNYTSGGLYDALGNPAVVDTDDGKNSAATFFVLDHSSGEVTMKMAPDCVPDRNSSSLRAEYPFASDDWLIAPDGKSLVVVKDGSLPCAWRFDLTTGKEVWLYQADRNAANGDKLPFMRKEPTLVSEDGVFVAGTGSDGVMYRLDMQTGAFSVLFTDTRHSIEPVLARAGMLYVLVTPNFDNNKRILRAIDANSGEKRWQLDLKVGGGLDDWLLQPSSAGLFLAQSLWSDDRIQFDVLDPQTGVNKRRQTQEMGHPSLTGQFIDGDTAWLNFSTKLHEIDMNTGTVKNTWP